MTRSIKHHTCTIRGGAHWQSNEYSINSLFQLELWVEILRKLKKPPPLIRPSVSKGSATPELIEIMRQCWSEAPESRPDFNTIHDTFKKFNQGKWVDDRSSLMKRVNISTGGRKSNIVDTMFEMIERYSNHLEDLIRERTEELDMERKKTEQLLNRMLPR